MNVNVTTTELAGMSLQDKQRLVEDLRRVRPDDRVYPQAQILLNTITKAKDWKEPVKVKVKAKQDVTVDGTDLKAGQDAEVFDWQWRALARFFERAAAILLLLAAVSVMAQPTTPTPTMGTSLYAPVAVAGLNGGTNSLAGNTTNILWSPVISTNYLTNVVWTQINGMWSNSLSTNQVYTTNILGRIALTHNGQVGVQCSYAGGTGTTTNLVTFPFWANVDGSTNAWPVFTLSCLASNTQTVTVGTNFNLGAPGYLFLWQYGNAGTNYLTNVTVQVNTKPGLTGL